MDIAVDARPAASAALAARRVDASAFAVALFGGAMLLSGFLLFLVEPMIARMVLPLLGGVPMVWNACVVFFQIVMLAGYGYAFAASRWLPIRRHVGVHALLLLGPAAVLPVVITAASVRPPSGNPFGWLLLLLAGTIGLPFFVLSTTASVLQHWLSRTDHPSARDPYFLYAASNAGCLLALASYPLLVEPFFTIREQAHLWSLGYALFAACGIACGAYAWRRQAAPSTAAAVDDDAEMPAAPLTLARRARWVALACIPSSLMLAVTSYISTDIAAVPLLWIVPLALYLCTFILAFGRAAARSASLATRALPLIVVPLALFMMARLGESIAAIVLHLVAFAVIAQYCHGRLAADRPDRRQLTEFYFWLSFGGMLGGLFNALAAPVLFTSVAEYPLAVLAACLFYRSSPSDSVRSGRRVSIYAVPVAIAAATAAVLWLAVRLTWPVAWQLAGLAVPAVLAFSQRRHGARFGVAMAAMIATGLAFSSHGDRVLHATRTFFGVYRVTEDPAGRYHRLGHGTTLHGMQALEPARQAEALSYYHESGPFGDAWRALPGARGREIAVVGLGVGTLASYAGADQHVTFFEIDPAIESIARTSRYFTFLDRCGDRCRVIVGDARISLAQTAPSAFDLLVLDAFSSDSIPIHLMTREALSLYFSRLTPRGAIVMHVSNRHLRLAPIVARLGADAGLFGAERTEANAPGWPDGKRGSHWIVLARDPRDLAPLLSRAGWIPLQTSPSTPLWTDDFSNILGVLTVR